MEEWRGLDTVNTKWSKLKVIGWVAGAVIALLFAWLFINVGLFVTGGSQDATSTLEHGERTTGILSNKRVIRDGFVNTIIVKYTFTTTSGQQVEGSYTYFWFTPNDLNIGQQIEISYDRHNPTTNLPITGNANQGSLKIFGWFLIIVMPLSLGSLAFWFGYKVWKAWRFSKYRVS